MMSVSSIDSVGIIGLGLIGGSIAKALKKHRPDLILTVWEPNQADRKFARQAGEMDIDATGDMSLFRGCQVIFLCTRVELLESYLELLHEQVGKSALIIDVGSVKLPVLRKACTYTTSLRFIGGHPMAGSEKSGYAHASADLFDQTAFILCPTPFTSDADLALAGDCVAALGAREQVLTAAEHDRDIALISHLPHVFAAALAALAGRHEHGVGTLARVSAGSFRDGTRVAASDPAFWSEVLLLNADSLAPLMDECIALFTALKTQLQQGDQPALERFFSTAKAYRDSLG